MIRIAVIGPESTGKTFLAEKLSVFFRCPMIREYAREYLGKLRRPYTYHDVLKIAAGQMEAERKVVKENPELLIADTELIVIKIWLEHKFRKLPIWLENNIRKNKYDLYLLCAPDLPWEFDPLRENPELGDYFFDLFQQELNSRNFPFVVIHGNEQQRIQTGIESVQKLLGQKKQDEI